MTLEWEGLTFASNSAKPKYPENVKAVVRKLLDDCPLPRDALPYTAEFARLKMQFRKHLKRAISDLDFWRALSSIGKQGGLARKAGRKKAPRTPRLTEEQQLEILRLIPDGIGNRDQLPYTKQFDDMHRRFVKLTGKDLDQHEFWRGLSRIAKLSRKPKPLFETAPLGGLPSALVQFLERTNPWWLAKPGRETRRFRRWAFTEVLSRLESSTDRAVVIRGPRRVGKTTIQEQVVEHLLLIQQVGPHRVLRVQFDEVPGLGSLSNPVEAVVAWYERNVLKDSINSAARKGEIVYLLFDELQNLHKWSEQLKSLVDHVTAHTFVTGSSALRIAKGRDNLAGRMTQIELGPLRLDEVAGIRGLRELPPFAPGVSLEEWKKREFWLDLASHGRKHARQREKVFSLFSEFGGYPSCHADRKQDVNQLRRQIVDDVVTKTIDFDPASGRHQPSLDRTLVGEVFRLMCRYAGQHVKPRRLAEQAKGVLHAGVTDKRINEVLQFLTDSMLLHKIQPLEMLLKGHKSSAKYCLCDHFVRNGMLQETVPIAPAALREQDDSVAAVAGHLIESSVGYFLKGVPGLDVAWFPERWNEPEVDFVLTIGTQRIPIEIKYRRRIQPADDCKGIDSFCKRKHYEAPFGLMITQDREGPIGDYTIALPASSFLLVR